MRLLSGLAALLVFLVVPGQVLAATTISTDAISNLSPVNGESFNVSASISGAQDGEIYFVKCRVGPADTSILTEGQTYNATTSIWLNDSGADSAWVNMPQVTIGPNGWSGTIQCRVKSDVSSGSKVVVARACLNENTSCGSSFQSSNSLAINSLATPTPAPTEVPSPTPTSTPPPTSATKTPTPTPKPTVKATVKPTSTPEVLGEEESVNLTDLRDDLTATPSPSPEPKGVGRFPLVAGFMIGGGVLFIILALLPMILKKLNANRETS